MESWGIIQFLLYIFTFLPHVRMIDKEMVSGRLLSLFTERREFIGGGKKLIRLVNHRDWALVVFFPLLSFFF